MLLVLIFLSTLPHPHNLQFGNLLNSFSDEQRYNPNSYPDSNYGDDAIIPTSQFNNEYQNNSDQYYNPDYDYPEQN